MTLLSFRPSVQLKRASICYILGGHSLRMILSPFDLSQPSGGICFFPLSMRGTLLMNLDLNVNLKMDVSFTSTSFNRVACLAQIYILERIYVSSYFPRFTLWSMTKQLICIYTDYYRRDKCPQVPYPDFACGSRTEQLCCRSFAILHACEVWTFLIALDITSIQALNPNFTVGRSGS